MSKKISLRNRFIQTILKVDKVMTWLYDSHIHLSDSDYHQDLDYIIKGMENINIKACCVSMDTKDSAITLEIRKKSKLILPFIGIHPERANDDLDLMIDLINKNNQNITGIG